MIGSVSRWLAPGDEADLWVVVGNRAETTWEIARRVRTTSAGELLANRREGEGRQRVRVFLLWEAVGLANQPTTRSLPFNEFWLEFGQAFGDRLGCRGQWLITPRVALAQATT